jgi:hypothetical protein
MGWKDWRSTFYSTTSLCFDVQHDRLSDWTLIRNKVPRLWTDREGVGASFLAGAVRSKTFVFRLSIA